MSADHPPMDRTHARGRNTIGGSCLLGGAGTALLLAWILACLGPMAPAAEHEPPAKSRTGRFVHIDLPGPNKTLSLAEVQVFSGGRNVATTGIASQSSTAWGAEARRAIDGNLSGDWGRRSITHTGGGDPAPAWEVDLKQEWPIERIVLWNRDGSEERLDGARVAVLDADRRLVWEGTVIHPGRGATEPLLGQPSTGLRRGRIIPPPGTDAPATADAQYEKFLSTIDLGAPALAAVKAAADAGDLAAAMRAYRGVLVERLAKMPRQTRFAAGAWGKTQADELLDGFAVLARYGDTTVNYRGRIGVPGRIDFFAAPAEYPEFARDISNLEWVNKYPEAYLRTKDVRYLTAWCATMADFTANWPKQWRVAQQDPVKRKIQGMGWIGATLMTSMRLYTERVGFMGMVQMATANGHLDQLDPGFLAGFLQHIVNTEMGFAVPCLGYAGGNQGRNLATEVFSWSRLLPELKNAGTLGELAIQNYTRTCLPDGTDKEQSLNYFNNTLGSIIGMLKSGMSEDDQEENQDLISRLGQMNQYRSRALPAIVRPDGFLPGTGTDPVWDTYGKRQALNPPSRAFTSILLPYGGFAVQRDGWKNDSLYLFMKPARPGEGHWRSQDGGLQLSAYGTNLLVCPMGQVYDSRDSAGGWTGYWFSAISQNAFTVDGRSAAKRTGAFDQLDPWRWHTSAAYDFMETEITGPYRGGDFRDLDAVRRERETKAEPVVITDAAHRRQVHFVREAGIWIVTDRLRSTQAHDFTQSWCLGPEFSEPEVTVDPAQRTLRTQRATGANLSLFQFGVPNLHYERFFGVRDQQRIIGWVGLMANREQWLYTPAVALHATWRGQGDALLVTLLSPRPGTAERLGAVTDRSTDGSTGFDAVLPDGRLLAYRCAVQATGLTAPGLAADASSLLVVGDQDGRRTGIVLDARSFAGKPAPQADFAFVLPGAGVPAEITPIAAPTGFRWSGSGKTLVPEYTAPEREPVARKPER